MPGPGPGAGAANRSAAGSTWAGGRPAETLAGTGSIGLLTAVVLGVTDPRTVAVIGAAVGLIPAAVTTLIAAGGVRGLLRKIWRGQ